MLLKFWAFVWNWIAIVCFRNIFDGKRQKALEKNIKPMYQRTSVCWFFTASQRCWKLSEVITDNTESKWSECGVEIASSVLLKPEKDSIPDFSCSLATWKNKLKQLFPFNQFTSTSSSIKMWRCDQQSWRSGFRKIRLSSLFLEN